MANYKIVNATTTSTVVRDLNGTSATAIRTLDIFPEDLPTMESELISIDVPGGAILKQQDGWLTWEIRLRIPEQTTTANLIAAINDVGTGFRNSANALMVQHDGEASPRYFNIIPTTVEAAIRQGLDNVFFNSQKMLPEWTIHPRTHPYPQGSSTPAWY